MKWEQFKNRLGKDARKEQVDVDVDAIWNAIEPQVDALNEREPRRRRFIFWFLFGGLLVLGSAWYYLEVNESYTAASTEKSIAINLDKESRSEGENLDWNGAKAPSETPGNTEEENREENWSDSGSSDWNGAKVSSETTGNTGEENRTNAEEGLIVNEEISTQNQQQKSAANQVPNIVATGPDISVFQNNISYNTSAPISGDEQILQETSSTIFNTKKETSATTALEDQVALLPLLPLSLIAEAPTSLPLNDFPPTFLTQKNKEEKTIKSLQLSVEVLGGLSAIKRTLSAKNTTANSLLDIRRANESTLEAHHYGLSIGLQHHSGFRLSFGLQQTTITERYRFDETQITMDSIQGVQVYRINPNGDTIPIIGMLPRITTTINNKDIYNTYRLLDLPVILSYQYPFGKWQAGLEAGAYLNLSLKTEGIIPDENWQDVNIETQQEEVFKSKVGVSYHLGLSLSRTVFDRFELRLAPSLRYFPQDFSVADYGLSQKYLLLGGNVGLRYGF